jgi:hypothetical protein
MAEMVVCIIADMDVEALYCAEYEDDPKGDGGSGSERPSSS